MADPRDYPPGRFALAPALGETPPATQREKLSPASGLRYAIMGRPGYTYATVDEGCAAAEELVRRLRLSQRVKVKVAGTEPETVVAIVAQDDAGIVIVRLDA